MGKKIGFVLFLLSIVLFSAFSSVASAASTLPSRIIGGVFSKLLKFLWSFIGSSTIAITGGPVVKYEDGYSVETVFDGSKHGIEPYTVEVLPSGEVLVLDSDNSNIYKISSPLSLYSRPKLITGSSQGYSGHVDGKLREARMNHPKGFTVDDSGNIYIADCMNMAIRKISDAGVTTIAGGKWARGGRFDAPIEDTKFSTDFDVVYVGSSCSLLVIDRGNQAIREIQLQYDDCANQYGFGSSLGIVLLLVAGFFGYLLALLQHRIGGTAVHSENDLNARKQNIYPYQKASRSSVLPPLIPSEDEQQKQEEGFVRSLGGLVVNAATSMVEVVGGLFSFRKKPLISQQGQHQYRQQQKRSNAWPLQESFEVREEEAPPSLDIRSPTPKKTYAFMEKDPEQTRHIRQIRGQYSWQDGEFQQQRQQKQQQQYEQQHSSVPETFYEQNSKSTKEIVFGAVLEQDEHRESKVKKSVDYSDPNYYHSHHARKYNVGDSHGC